MEEQTLIPDVKKPFSIWKFLKRLFLSLVIGVISVLGISILLVYVYEDDVKQLIIKELNKHLKAEVRIDPKNIDLTILKSFPKCALEFKDLTAMEAKEFSSSDTLLFAKRLALEFNVKDLFNKNYNIKNIVLENAHCHLKVDKKGNANYLVWRAEGVETNSDSLNFALEKITLNAVEVSYKNSKGRIKLEASIKQLDFTGKFSNADYLLTSKGNAWVDLFQVDKVKYVNDKQLKFDIEFDVTGNKYTIRRSETSINATQLISNGAFVIQDSLLSLDINFNGKNLDISSTLSLLPEKFQSQITDYKSDGEFYAKGECHYKNGQPLSLTSEFGIKKASITYKPQNTTLSNVNLLGSISISDKHSVLKLQNITANLNSNTFSGDVELSNFKDPYLKLKLAANTKLEELMAFYPIDTIREASGTINVNAEIEGLISEMKANAYSPNIKASGQAVLSNLKAKFKQSEREMNIPEGELKLNNRYLNVYNLKFINGTSDVMLVGEMPNFLGYLFDAATPLTVIASVTSDHINVDDFIFGGSQSNSSSSVSISDKLDLNISVNAKRLEFGKFTATDIKGNLLVKDQKAALKELSLNATDGTITLNVFADASGGNIKVSGDCNLNKLSIQKLFTGLNNFGQTTLQDKHLKGFMTADVDFSATWDKKLNIDPASINATSSLLVERGELIGFKPLESLGKYIDVNELKHIKFSSLQSAVQIKNKLITIPRTSIKSTAISLELWGTHSFDNRIDYHIQLLLSEVLSKRPKANKDFDEELSLVENDPENRRSVFILMTGPIDNPSIKYDRKGAKEKIKQDIQQEKQNVKQILKEEFGFFKKDTASVKKQNDKAEQKFNIQFGEEKPKKDKPLQPKKKEEEDDDF
jgi:hypothetical protein